MITQELLEERIALSASVAEERAKTEQEAKEKRNKPTQGGCFCRQEMKGCGRKGKTSKQLCSCGYNRRGRNHEEGTHHKQGKLKK